MNQTPNNFEHGYISGRIDWTESLFSLRVHVRNIVYKPGQFVKLALYDQKGELIRRAYSIVNHPDDYKKTGSLEFLVVADQTGKLSPLLHQLDTGNDIYVSVGASGFMTLEEVPEDTSSLWLLSTGSALGPFLSLLDDKNINQFEHVVLVHATRQEQDLIYQAKINELKSSLGTKLTYVPIVSREYSDIALHGRIPDLITYGQLEHAVGIPLLNQSNFFYLCGNPDMVKDTGEVLKSIGFNKHLRKKRGHYSSENYW